ncbi:MAG: glycosyltransferase, partial [Candidatus Dadabacteria bacterium]|nr:glycosyltransferase [Candidatus Dadabacteria bacterium]NIT13058.1 glycosyltransferase [Candidatus Dadabacteria bacterium]
MIATINLLSLFPVIKKIICVSKPTQAQFKFAGHKTVVINNGVDIDDFNPRKVNAILRNEYEVSSGQIIVGTTGRIVPRKKYEIFIDIAQKLKKEHEDLYNKTIFAIVGDTPYYFRVNQFEILKNLVLNNGMRGKFIFTGYKEDIRPYLKDFDIFVLTSDYPDPFPRSVIEAMAFSKPVVGFDIGGITESVQNNQNGYLCHPGDIDQMSQKIVELLKSKTKRTTM